MNYKNIVDILINVYFMLDNEEFLSLLNVCFVMNDFMVLEEFDWEYKDFFINFLEVYYVIEEVIKCLGDVIDDLDFDVGLL